MMTHFIVKCVHILRKKEKTIVRCNEGYSKLVGNRESLSVTDVIFSYYYIDMIYTFLKDIFFCLSIKKRMIVSNNSNYNTKITNIVFFEDKIINERKFPMFRFLYPSVLSSYFYWTIASCFS
jgi:hypothetical protein